MAHTRFIGANVPIELFQAIEEARGERGIPERTSVIRAALALWLENNVPANGISKAVAEIIVSTTKSKAAREAMDTAITEWRLAKSESLLTKIQGLDTLADLIVPDDVRTALKGLGEADDG